MSDKQLSPTIEKLSEQLRVSNRLLQKQLSTSQILMRSIIQGAGYAIGAGVVASILVAVLARVLASLPWLQNIL